MGNFPIVGFGWMLYKRYIYPSNNVSSGCFITS